MFFQTKPRIRKRIYRMKVILLLVGLGLGRWETLKKNLFVTPLYWSVYSALPLAPTLLILLAGMRMVILWCIPTTPSVRIANIGEIQIGEKFGLYASYRSAGTRTCGCRGRRGQSHGAYQEYRLVHTLPS